MNIHIFLDEHISTVYDYELSRLPEELTPVQIQMESWKSSWRRESLEYYSKKGWSFVAFQDDKLQGYVLTQPLLFFNNWTQSLWLEHLSFNSDEVGRELVKTCVGWAKTKHLQKFLVNSKIEACAWVQSHFPSFKKEDYLQLSITKTSGV